MAKTKTAPSTPEPAVNLDGLEPNVDQSMLQGSEVMSDDAFGAMLQNMREGKVTDTTPEDKAKPEEPKESQPAPEPEAEATEPDTAKETEEPEPETEAAAIAENKRLRAKNREKDDAIETLKEELAKINARLDESAKKQDAQADPVKASLQAASEADLLDAKEKLDLAVFDANQDGDREAYQKAVKGRSLVDAELRRRSQAQPAPASTDQAKTQFQSIKDTLIERYPGAMKADSAFGKAVQSFAKENAALMQTMGPLGEVLAVASVIGLHPELLTQGQAKAVTQKIETGINKVVERSVNRSRSTQPVTQPAMDVPNTIDGMNEVIEKMKRGELTLAQLG